MRNKVYSMVASVAVLAGVMGQAHAAPITVSYDEVGELSEATFGGSGIPNSEVAITQFEELICTRSCRPTGLGITLGMSAHGRYQNMLEGSDGAGTYFASPGSNVPPGSSLEGATWNFNYFIDIQNSTLDGNYSFKLFYDFDPVVGNDIDTHGVFDITAAYGMSQTPLSDISRVEGSQNLLFSFLGNDSPFISAPASTFDPNATGEYSFALAAFRGNTEVARTAIKVAVGTAAVPEPGALALFGLGLLAMARRSMKKR